MATAPSFAHLERLSEPFEENGKEYILVKTKSGTTRKVRWYEEPMKKIRPVKEVLGFSKGYIYLVKGDTYNFKDWLRESEAVYRTFWGWAFPSDVELPQLPAGLSVVKLLWEKVAYVDEDELRTQSAIDEAVAEIMYDPSPSKWQGEVGDRITRYLTVVKATELPDGYYGPSIFFLMEDEDGNEYTWTTAARKLEVGESYKVVGTIKSLNKYKGKEQSVLTRCRVN